MVLEDTDIPIGGYGIIEIHPETLKRVDISDFSTVI